MALPTLDMDLLQFAPDATFSDMAIAGTAGALGTMDTRLAAPAMDPDNLVPDQTQIIAADPGLGVGGR